MFLNFVILLALAGAVKSSVIINVFQDGANKAPHSLGGGCNYRACDQLCRRLGFTGGACVGDKCKCDNFAPVIDSRTGYSQSGVGACDFRACDQLCRRLGFPGGACIGDKCKCDNYAMSAENQDDEPTHVGCNQRSCEKVCRKHGFPGGACAGNKCKCHNFEPIIVKGTALDYLLRSGGKAKPSDFLDGCNFNSCAWRCRNFGFPGGACIGDKCDCDEFKEEYNEDEYTNVKESTKGGKENSKGEDKMYLINIIDNPQAATLPRDCDAFKCSDMCYRMHYFGGICSNGSCECY